MGNPVGMIDPLWRKVDEAYQQVSREHSRKVTVEQGSVEATVYYVDGSKTKSGRSGVIVAIMEVEMKEEDNVAQVGFASDV